jgi:hypothetical protein
LGSSFNANISPLGIDYPKGEKSGWRSRESQSTVLQVPKRTSRTEIDLGSPIRMQKPNTTALQFLNNLKQSTDSSSVDKLEHKISERSIGSETPISNKDISPFAGYNLKDLVSLKEAVVPLLPYIPDLMAHVELSFEFVRERVKDPEILKQPDGFAAVNLYTQEWEPHTKSLYFQLNGLLSDNNMEPSVKFDKIKPYHQYLHLLLHRLQSLPKFKGNVYRGFNLDLKHVFKRNSIHTWWTFTSCTDVLGGITDFLDKQGPRTFLEIYTYRGVKISEYSFHNMEN